MGALRYHAALLNIRRAARDFVDAFLDAARAAQEIDPEGRALPDPLALQVFDEVVALLGAGARIPGAREIFLAALAHTHKE